MKTYRIIRMYRDGRASHTVRGGTGLTLEQAQAHCRDPETSSSTCTDPIARRRTKEYGPWFDGYEEER